MEDRFEISILLDLYGALLTEKQYKLMNLYFNEDFSLGEIAEINSISRQATFDGIKRCQKILYGYEEKLHLLKRQSSEEELKENIINKINNIIDSIDYDNVKSQLNDLKDFISST